MFMRRLGGKKRGFSLMEYTIVIGVVLASFTMMNTYIKRGLQGRVKNITDHFFGSNAQSTETSPTATSTSVSYSVSDSDSSSRGVLGGQTQVDSTDSRDYNATSVVSDKSSIYVSPVTTGSAGEQSYAVTHSTTSGGSQ